MSLNSAVAQVQGPTILNELAMQKNYGLIQQGPNQPSTNYPCPNLLEVQQSPQDTEIFYFNYAPNSNPSYGSSNLEFVIVDTKDLNTGWKQRKKYNRENDVHSIERKLTKADRSSFNYREILKYRDGISSFFSGFGRPYRLFHHVVDEIEVTKTAEGFKIVKKYTDSIRAAESYERVCFYKKS